MDILSLPPNTRLVEAPSADGELFPLGLDMQRQNFTDWLSYTSELGKLSLTGIQWLVGDLLRYGELWYSEDYSQAVPTIDRAAKTLLNWQSIAKSYSSYVDLFPNVGRFLEKGIWWDDKGRYFGTYRRADLPHTHHGVLSSMRGPLVNARAVLMQRAIVDTWSISDLTSAKTEALKKIKEAANDPLMTAAAAALTTPIEVNIGRGTVYFDGQGVEPTIEIPLRLYQKMTDGLGEGDTIRLELKAVITRKIQPALVDGMLD